MHVGDEGNLVYPNAIKFTPLEFPNNQTKNKSIKLTYIRTRHLYIFDDDEN